MVRPCKERNIENIPCNRCFWPLDAWENTTKIQLFVDEYEALRLSNMEGCSNISWALKMWISAPTFNRLIKRANKKLTQALVNWECIFICCDVKK